MTGRAVSLRWKRRIWVAGAVISAAGIAVNAALAISGHPARYVYAIFVIDSLGVVSCLASLRQMRGRP